MLFFFLECSSRYFHGLISQSPNLYKKICTFSASPCLATASEITTISTYSLSSLCFSPLSLLLPNILCTLHARLYKHTLYFTCISNVCLSSPNHTGSPMRWHDRPGPGIQWARKEYLLVNKDRGREGTFTENSSFDMVEKSALHSFSTFAEHTMLRFLFFSDPNECSISWAGFPSLSSPIHRTYRADVPKTNCSENFSLKSQ